MSTPTANNAIVAGIQGQAWARSPDGSLRALATGDVLRADDTLVLAPGARVAVAIDGAPAISFVGPDAAGTVTSLAPGEIRVPAQPAAPAAEPAARNATPPAPQARPSGDQPSADDVPRMGDGHGFVELVRILEIVEADGITPLTLARIQEIIPPMGMNLPHYPIDEDRWLWHQGGELGGGRIIPLAVPDTETTHAGTPVTTPVLANDSFEGTPVVTVAAGHGPSHGTVTVNPDGSITYIPTPGYVGPDSYTYTVSSGGRTETATVTIAVTNTPPVAQPDTNTITEDGPALVVGVADGVIRSGSGAGMDSDADKDPLTVFGVAAGTTGQAGLDASLVGQPITGQYGTLVLNADGSYTYTLDNSNPAVNALRNGDTLQDSFSYGITDGNDGGAAVTTLTIVIDGRTDGPPAIVPDDHNGPGDGTLTAGQVTVHEASLRADVPAGADKTATGSIAIDTPDGLAGISVGGTPLTLAELLAIGPGNPVTILTPQGTLTLTGFTPTASVGGVPTQGTLDYHYELGTPVDNAPGAIQATDPIALSVTDAGGGTDTATLVVNIVDDVPVAVADTNTVPVGSYDPVAGHLVDGTGVGADGRDTRGADGASVTVVRDHAGVDTPISATGSTEIQGRYGKLVIDADGSYTYTRDLGSPSDVTEVFTYTLADSDGDSSNATLTIAIGSGNPAITGLTPAASGGELSFEERHLANGSSPDPTQSSKTGSFTLASPDGVKTLVIFGTTVIANDSVVATPTVTTPLGHTLEVLGYDPVTGVVDYRYTLGSAGPHDKATHDHSLFDDLSVLLTDHNDRTASGTLSVQILDDTPAITIQADQLGALAVDETTFSGGQASATDASFVKNVFGVRHGADGPAAGSPLVYSLDIAAAGTASGINDTATGHEIHLYKEGNDIVGRVGQATGADPAGAIALRITIDGSDPDGPVTLTQYRPLAHLDDADHDDVLQLATDAITLNTNADATGSNTMIGAGPDAPRHGTAVVNPDGTITYTPNGNYSGTDRFTYTTSIDGEAKTFTVEIMVTPSADAPQLGVDRIVDTLEDTPAVLGLTLPVIADGVDQNGSTVSGDDTTLGDNPERIGAITLALSGAPAGTALVTGGTTLTAGSDGNYTIVIVGTTSGTDVDTGLHIRPADLPSANVNYLTAAQYQAIQAQLAAHRHENFEVSVTATSYEVDDSGSPQAGLVGATSTQTLSVAVQAVTDNAVLVFDQAVISGATRATVDGSTVNETYSVVYGNPAAPGTELDTRATVTLREDSSFDLKNLLDASFQDLDGSELRSITIQNTTGQAILVNGTTLAAGASRNIATPGLSTSETNFPQIRIGATGDFSGILDGIRITLNAQDRDADGYWNGTTMVPGAPNLNGTAEAVTTDNTVVLGLHVLPRAGDVRAGNVSTSEDTAVAFLAGIEVTDTSTAGGSEVISRVAFDIPAGWTLTPPVAGVDGIPANGWQTSISGSAVTITFDDGVLSETLREQVLDGFMIRPPAHSSLDAALTARVTTVDTRGADSHTVEKPLQIGITVTPVAERVGSNSNGDGSDDVGMNPDHAYSAHGFEDGWFALNSDGFDLEGPWRNEDGQGVANGGSAGQGSEQTFARFTPYHLGAELDGSSFQYHDGTALRVVHFNGTPVDIPIAYLDSLQFRGPTNFKGVVEIKVQAVTIDHDEDTNTPTAPAVSGEAWLTNLILHPVADQVTLKVGARITAHEDDGRDGSSPIPLRITPSSDDPTETFNVTIRKIPAGASILYDGVTYDVANGLVPAGDGSYLLALPDFDASLGMALIPPKDSNAPIQLEVEAVSIDTLSYVDQHGVPQVITSPPSAPHILPITITLQGVPDEPVLVIDGAQVYDEAVLDSAAAPNQIALRDLITELRSGETAPGDTSETVTLRISGLAEGFELLGAGPVLGVATGADRVWVVTPDQIASGAISLRLPPNYSGTVTFNAQPVVTESDNPSDTSFEPRNVSFQVVPAPEAELQISSTMVEDLIRHVDLAPAHRNGDTDEEISALRIREEPGVSFYGDAAGTQPLVAVGGWYEIAGAENVASVYARGPANFSGNIALEVQYKVTDTAADGSTGPVESPWLDANHTLVFVPVTDPVALSLVSIDGNASASTAHLIAAGNVTLALNLAKLPDPNTVGNLADEDGSERLTHILIEGVPDGVEVQGAMYTGNGEWLMLLPNTPANHFTGDIALNIVFAVSGRVGEVTNAPITITAVTRDGNTTVTADDSITWHLSTSVPPGPGDALPSVSLAVIDAPQNEDQAFALSEIVSGSIDTTGANVASYDMTVTLRTTLFDEVSFTNMTRTEVVENGQPVVLWTYTVSGVTDATAQSDLQDALDAIGVVPPQNANGNANNLDGRMPPLDVTVTLHGNGLRSEDRVEPEVSLTPVTDPAMLAIDAPATSEGTPVQITVEVSNAGDRPGDWSIVDGRLYLKLNGAGIPGALAHGGTDLVLTPVAGIPGLPDGNYYIVDGVAPDTVLNLTYTPADPHDKGSVTLQAWVQNQETGSVALLSSQSQTLIVTPTNTAPAITITADGLEHDGATPARAQLNVAGTVLPDAGEQLVAAFIEGLPNDFAVYYGTSSATAVLANNAGGSGPTSTWSIPVAGNALPAYIAIQPPAHWSGTLADLQLYLVSGESVNTPTAWPVAFDLVIAPQADGLALAPTLSFGKAGDIVALHLNAAMKDPVAAGASDGHSERTTLQLSGFPDGDKVVFHANGTALDASRVSFAGGVYTITGLSQAELDGLGFQHGGTGGTQTIDVTAWTQEVDPTGHPVGAPSAPVVSSEITINIADKLPTPGADTLLWTGSLLDGRDGDDTLQLRYGENLAGSDLAAALRNIEKIELGVTSDNTISGLNVADVFDMTDTRNALEILGNGQDTVHLEGGWNNDGNGIFTGLHSGQAITLTVQAGVETYLNGVLIE